MLAKPKHSPPAGETRTATVSFAQTVAEYIESFHARNGLSRERMGKEAAEAFDRELRAVVSPHCPDGIVRMQVTGVVTWGRPVGSEVDQARLFVGGWSLGSAVAIDLASRRPVRGLIAFSAFSGMMDMAQEHFPFLPTALLLRHRFENAQKMARIASPAFLAHGTRDTLVPFAMRDHLAAAANGPVTCYDVVGARHGDLFAVGGKSLLQRLGAFLAACDGEGK